MPTAGSPDPETLHQGELDLLISDLVEAGFRPRPDDRHHWTGPTRASLRRLTPATEMRIEIRDGWPYLHPYVHVDGLAGRKHVNVLGNTCLWFEDDDSYSSWLRLETILDRIDAWVADQETGVVEPALDAHLYFGTVDGSLLTVDVEGLIARGSITRAGGSSGLLRATHTGTVFAVGERGNLSAAWFWHTGLAAPPTDPLRLRDSLTRSQRRTYDQITANVSRSRVGVLLVLWDDAGTINALGLKVERATPGRYRLVALEVARTDSSILRLRSGPDAPLLASTAVAVFGVGAIGSEIALLLARSGVGHLVLIDREVLRPSNLSRHAAAAQHVGKRKTDAMAATIREALPDTKVQSVNGVEWRPGVVAAIAAGVNLIVDATGNRAFTDMLSRIAAVAGAPLVAVALHRSGQVARVRAQVDATCQIWDRSPDGGFPEVPMDPEPARAPTWETGCGSPVNNAPPVAVSAAASMASRMIVDVLAGRSRRNQDVFEVYVGIEEAPFDAPGVLVFEQPS
ncbi:MAG: ThiF family adenylyltransferase [Chloroflexi bacterium]|nr:ThiF family adenylyltransferase [Chloroflexota bacterium]